MARTSIVCIHHVRRSQGPGQPVLQPRILHIRVSHPERIIATTELVNHKNRVRTVVVEVIFPVILRVQQTESSVSTAKGSVILRVIVATEANVFHRPDDMHYHVEVDDEPDDVEDDALYAFAASGAHGAIRVNIHLGQAQATALIDSGATCNLMGVNQLVQLEENGLTVSLQPCRQALFAYGGKDPLPLAGKFAVPTTVNGVTLNTTFVVIQGEGEILLGRKSSEAFRILTLPTAENIVYSPHEDVKAAEQQKFPDVFTGIGTLRDYETKIHVDPTVMPVAQKPRRVPFALPRRSRCRSNCTRLFGWVSR